MEQKLPIWWVKRESNYLCFFLSLRQLTQRFEINTPKRDPYIMSNVESCGILTLHGPGHASMERIMSNYRCLNLAPYSRTRRNPSTRSLGFSDRPSNAKETGRYFVWARSYFARSAHSNLSNLANSRTMWVGEISALLYYCPGPSEREREGLSVKTAF